MQLAQLLHHVHPDHVGAVKARYVAFARAGAGSGFGDSAIDAFAQHLHADGLLDAAALREFLTWRALHVDHGAVGPAEVAGEGPRRRYELLALLGKGGMGEVHLGSEPGLTRTVAIKRIHPHLHANSRVLRRFLTEARITAQLDHPAIVPVYGVEMEPGGEVSYAMKFVRGETLSAFLSEAEQQIRDEGRPRPTHALRARIELFVPVLNALAYAHKRGVIHRDLKPENIMVGSFGEVLVMDWGIAGVVHAARPGVQPRLEGDEAIDGADDAEAGFRDTLPTAGRATAEDEPADGHGGITRPGDIMGTPDFMSPEQAAGAALDGAADQFALGMMLQEIATLRPARSARSAAEGLRQAAVGERAPIADGAERVPRELRAIIARATAFEPARRYASVEAMADDLRRFLRDESVEAAPDRGLQRLARWVGRHRGLVLAGLAGLFLIGVATAATLLWRHEVALSEARAAAAAREGALLDVASRVDGAARHMTAQLHGLELTVARLAGHAAVVLTEPAPPAPNAIAYRYGGDTRIPEDLHVRTLPSAFYGQPASLDHADYTLAWGLDPAALRPHIDQVARLEEPFREALLASGQLGPKRRSPGALAHAVLQEGLPVVWAYFGSAAGVSVGLPGTWDYGDSPGADGYDHRLESWYRDGASGQGPVWTSGVDENGLGLLLSVTMAARDKDGTLLGVAALDLGMEAFLAALLSPPMIRELGGDAVLLDLDGRVLVRASGISDAADREDYEPPLFEEPAVLEAASRADVGRVSLPDGRLAVWQSLGSAGLRYVVIGDEAQMMSAVSAGAPSAAGH